MFGDKEFADREASIALEVEEACVGVFAGCLCLRQKVRRDDDRR